MINYNKKIHELQMLYKTEPYKEFKDEIRSLITIYKQMMEVNKNGKIYDESQRNKKNKGI